MLAVLQPSVILDVEPDSYEAQLQKKAQRIKELFADFSMPATVEVFDSARSNYRERCEFNVRHEGDRIRYVMFAQPNAEQPQEQQEDQQQQQQQPQEQQQQHQQEQQPQAQQQEQEQAQPLKKQKKSKSKPAKKKRASPVPIETFPIASELINELMGLIRTHVGGNPLLQSKLFQVNFHTTTSGEAMVTMLYHKKLDDAWTEAATQLRSTLQAASTKLVDRQLSIIGRSRGQKVELDRSHVIERFTVGGRQYSYMQVEGSFSQPNGGVCQKMLQWALDVTQGSQGDLLELYCGNGNFTMPLAQNFRRVVATEVAGPSVAAAKFNMEQNKVDNIFIARMASEEFTEAWRERAEKVRLKDMGSWDDLHLDTIFVDPPRAGLDPLTTELLRKFDRIVYISCNPETLQRDLGAIQETHEIKRFAIFDQFPYTDHIESGAYLHRRAVPVAAGGAQ